MGWDSIFAGLLAGWIIEKHDQKKKQKAQLLHQQSYSSSGVSSISERIFVNARNKQLTESYKNMCLNYTENPNSNFYINTLRDSVQTKLRYYYSRLEVNPSSFDCRSELIHFILNLWKNEENKNMIDLLQNELIYMIDYMHAHTQEEHMYQHLAMFLSAECYFFKGDFAKALKRLYQVLDWQEIYDNVDNQNGFDFNGLYYFHEATVSNIINLYALVGLPEKTDEVRSACKGLVTEAQNSYHSLMATSGNDANIKSFLQNKYDMIMATNSFQGYYLISDTSYKNNLFKESITAVIRGQAIYSIETLPYDCKSLTIIETREFIDDKLANYNPLCLQGFDVIPNYEEVLDRNREKMRII